MKKFCASFPNDLRVFLRFCYNAIRGWFSKNYAAVKDGRHCFENNFARVSPAKIMNKNYYLPATVCALAVCLALGFAAAAWVEPNGIPPADNVVAPINTGGEAQYKTGGLGVKIGGAVTYWISQIGDKLAFKTGNDFATAVETVNINTDGRIGNVAAPIDDKDAVNKAYLDARLSGGTGGGGNIKNIYNWAVLKNIQTSSTSYSYIPFNCSTTSCSGTQTITTSGPAKLFIMWNAGVAVDGAANRCQIRIMVDGAQAGALASPSTSYNYMGGSYAWDTDNSGISVDSMGGNAVVSVGAGSHTIGLQWRNQADEIVGTSYIWPTVSNGYGASLTVMEIAQ